MCALVDSMARAAGLRTVLLTKPHLLSWCERIAVDERPLEEQRFADLVALVLGAADRLPAVVGSPTVFEVVTAAGIVAAREANPDVLICEVGLGGRLDSTNVLDLGVAVVTGIGLDHAAELGRDLAGIAAEKAAIIKPGNDVVTGAEGVALEVIRSAARDAAATSVTAVMDADTWWRCEDLGRAGVAVETGDPAVRLVAPLIGGFQCRNLVVAAHTARALARRGVAIPDAATRRRGRGGALAGADAVDRWLPGRPGRWLSQHPGGHRDGRGGTAAVRGPSCRRRLRGDDRQGPR